MSLEDEVKGEFFVRTSFNEDLLLRELSQFGIEIVYKYATGVYHLRFAESSEKLISRMEELKREKKIDYYEPVRKSRALEDSA
ncbi:MAG: hypothetical protein QXW00_00070 [Candidatus Woesearchaeota archaeon]